MSFATHVRRTMPHHSGVPGMINQNQHPSSQFFAHCLSSLPCDEESTFVDRTQLIPLKRRNYYTCMLFCILLLLLCSCSNPPSPSQTTSKNTASTDHAPLSASPTPSTALTRVDWMNYTYTSSCYDNTQPFHVQHGMAVNNGVRI